MSIYNLSDDRMLCWDDFLIGEQKGIEIKMQKPCRKGPAFLAREEMDGGDAVNEAYIEKYRSMIRML